jgi:hypothetical protein
MADNDHPRADDDLASQLARQAAEPASQENEPASQENKPASQENKPASQENEPASQKNEFAAIYAARLAAISESFRQKIRTRAAKASLNTAVESAALDAIICDYTTQYLRKRESSRLGAARRRQAKKEAAIEAARKAAALEAAALEAARRVAEPAEPAEPTEPAASE